jgi:hypothetical protein
VPIESTMDTLRSLADVGAEHQRADRRFDAARAIAGMVRASQMAVPQRVSGALAQELPNGLECSGGRLGRASDQ